MALGAHFDVVGAIFFECGNLFYSRKGDIISFGWVQSAKKVIKLLNIGDIFIMKHFRFLATILMFFVPNSSRAMDTGTLPDARDTAKNSLFSLAAYMLVQPKAALGADEVAAREVKKQKRLVRNRLTAQRSRDNKNAYIRSLEGEKRSLEEENSGLKLENNDLKNTAAENESLRLENAILKNLLDALQEEQKSLSQQLEQLLPMLQKAPQ